MVRHRFLPTFVPLCIAGLGACAPLRNPARTFLPVPRIPPGPVEAPWPCSIEVEAEPIDPADLDHLSEFVRRGPFPEPDFHLDEAGRAWHGRQGSQSGPGVRTRDDGSVWLLANVINFFAMR